MYSYTVGWYKTYYASEKRLSGRSTSIIVIHVNIIFKRIIAVLSNTKLVTPFAGKSYLLYDQITVCKLISFNFSMMNAQD